MSSTCETTPTRPIPVPSPKSAVTIGRPIARNEPKLISRTTIAASSPIAVVERGSRELDLLDRLPAELDLEPRGADRLGRRHDLLDRSGRQLVCPLVEEDRREGRPAVARDAVAAARLVGADDPRHVRQRRDPGEHRRDGRAGRRDRETVPERVWKTIWSASPAWAGKALRSRSAACWEPVFPRLKFVA